jgi:hypothetical protein
MGPDERRYTCGVSLTFTDRGRGMLAVFGLASTWIGTSLNIERVSGEKIAGLNFFVRSSRGLRTVK